MSIDFSTIAIQNSPEQEVEKAKGLIIWILKAKQQVLAMEAQLAAISISDLATAKTQLVQAGVLKEVTITE